MKRTLFKTSFIFLGTLLICLCTTALMNVKASSYNYDFFKNVIPSSEGLAYDLTYYSNTIKFMLLFFWRKNYENSINK